MTIRMIKAGLVACTWVIVCGCVDVNTLVSVNKDGSGTVTETTFLGVGMKNMMEAVSAMSGQATNREEKPLIDVERYKAKAAVMGAGVRMDSVSEVKKDGKSGVRAIYEFDDVRKLRLSQQPDWFDGEAAGVKAVSVGEKTPVTFEFFKGDNSALVVNIPEGDCETGTSATDHVAGTIGNSDATERPSPEELVSIRELFRGFRLRLLVTVDGEIVGTNASYVDTDESDKRKYVTIYDMDIGKLLGQGEHMKELADLAGVQDVTVARSRLKNMPGLRIETARRLEIVFR